jgi:hypothetical protein
MPQLQAPAYFNYASSESKVVSLAAGRHNYRDKWEFRSTHLRKIPTRPLTLLEKTRGATRSQNLKLTANNFLWKATASPRDPHNSATAFLSMSSLASM